MTLSAILKKFFTKSCVYFSVLTALYALLVMITNVDDELVLLDAARILLFFVASMLFSLANILLSFGKLSGPLKVLLHYLICLLTFCTCFMLPISPESSTMVVGIVLFTIIYAISLTVILVVRSRYKVRAEKHEDYTTQFKK